MLQCLHTNVMNFSLREHTSPFHIKPCFNFYRFQLNTDICSLIWKKGIWKLRNPHFNLINCSRLGRKKNCFTDIWPTCRSSFLKYIQLRRESNPELNRCRLYTLVLNIKMALIITLYTPVTHAHTHTHTHTFDFG